MDLQSIIYSSQDNMDSKLQDSSEHHGEQSKTKMFNRISRTLVVPPISKVRKRYLRRLEQGKLTAATKKEASELFNEFRKAQTTVGMDHQVILQRINELLQRNDRPPLWTDGVEKAPWDWVLLSIFILDPCNITHAFIVPREKPNPKTSTGFLRTQAAKNAAMSLLMQKGLKDVANLKPELFKNMDMIGKWLISAETERRRLEKQLKDLLRNMSSCIKGIDSLASNIAIELIMKQNNGKPIAELANQSNSDSINRDFSLLRDK
jgi:hypothetical protein